MSATAPRQPSGQPANPVDDWQDCNLLLTMALDSIEERRDAWRKHFEDLVEIARRTDTLPNHRKWPTCSPFAAEMHHALAMALRNDPERRGERLSHIGAALACKAAHQDTFLAMVDELAEAARELAARRPNGMLEPDAADPIVGLRDGLLYFNVIQVKTEMRELLRDDQYAYQATKTNDHPTIVRFGAFLAGPDFATWQLSAPAAGCGAIAKGHPERFTWFRAADAPSAAE
jgi:hypothetical protein